MIKGYAKDRVLIAKDVIKWIASKKLNVIQRRFCSLHKKPVQSCQEPVGDIDLIDKELIQSYIEEGCINRIFEAGEDELRDFIRENVAQCSVCAKGAIFMTAVDRFDAVKIQDVIKNYGVSCGFDTGNTILLNGLFTEKQLNLIEVAFEGRDDIGECGDGNSRKAQKKALDFYDRIHEKGPEFVLTYIMRNIIENKGTFKP